MKRGRNRLIFLGGVLLLSWVYFVYAWLVLPPTREAHGALSDLGEGMGSFAVWGLVLLYCRGMFKLVINDGPLLKRFLPAEIADTTQNMGQKILRVLNRTHPALGVVTIVLIAGHAGLSSTGRLNLFLILTMAVMFWQGGFGLFLKSKWTPLALRKHSFGVHAQLVTGILILIFAGFGHLLVGN